MKIKFCEVEINTKKQRKLSDEYLKKEWYRKNIKCSFTYSYPKNLIELLVEDLIKRVERSKEKNNY